MRVTVYGTGYVGLVSGACIAETGCQVLCVDVDAGRIEQLRRGDLPIREPGLADIVQHNLSSGRLQFTADIAHAVSFATIQMIAVGTPPGVGGQADIQFVLDVARSIGAHMREYKLVATKSTVPVGTADYVADEIRCQLENRNEDIAFDVAANPEFLKEGSAVADFQKPDRIIIGAANPRAVAQLLKLYEPFNCSHSRMLLMDLRSAELCKYAANAMLATKISLMNELAGLADALGADIEKVRLGIGADPRIGYDFIYPGCGFGGSCLPKDIRAIEAAARAANIDLELIAAVARVNDQQKKILFKKLFRHFRGNLDGKTVALWGLAFKPETADMCDAPSREFMEACWATGVSVRAYDPAAGEEAQRIYGKRGDLVLCSSPMDALVGADTLVIATEWREFRSPDFSVIAKALSEPVIIDGRNLYDPEQLRGLGFDYYPIGRGSPG
jgi:UDPglucose 6-dehydrogenase